MKNYLLFFSMLLCGSVACKPLEVVRGFFEPKTDAPNSAASPVPSSASSPSSSPTPSATPSAATVAQFAKANAEILSEIFKVTFNEDSVEDRSNFGQLVHSLNEGASIEGIYRGIIMGVAYRTLEVKSRAASPAMIKSFAMELAQLQSTMREPTHFTAESAKSPPEIDFPEGIDENTKDAPSVATVGTVASTNQSPATNDQSESAIKEKAKDLVVLFLGASPFTLKRIMGDEALKKIEELTLNSDVKKTRGELADWYARLAVHMAETHVDFGLPLRNESNLDFHFKFAEKMPLDRIRWEVLNRYHRYFNSLF